MTPQEYIQLKAFARQDGAFLALLWIGSFVCYILGLTNPMLGLVAMLLICSTPFLAASRLRHYRDYGREGIISFARSYAYTVMIFFYAGVLLAIVIYLYFAFMDHGFLLSQFSRMISSEEMQQALKHYGMTQMVDETMQEMANTRPIDYALNMLTINISLGFIMGLPLGLIMQRSVKRVSSEK